MNNMASSPGEGKVVGRWCNAPCLCYTEDMQSQSVSHKLTASYISLTSILDTLLYFNTPSSFSTPSVTVLSGHILNPNHLYPQPTPTTKAVRDRLPTSITGWWMRWKVVTPLPRVHWIPSAMHTPPNHSGEHHWIHRLRETNVEEGPSTLKKVFLERHLRSFSLFFPVLNYL